MVGDGQHKTRNHAQHSATSEDSLEHSNLDQGQNRDLPFVEIVKNTCERDAECLESESSENVENGDIQTVYL